MGKGREGGGLLHERRDAVEEVLALTLKVLEGEHQQEVVPRHHGVHLPGPPRDE